MAVVTVNVWRPIDGRAAEFMAQISEAKKIHERLGGQVRVLQAGAGPDPFTIHYCVEHADGKSFGAFQDKMLADPEWQAFWAKALTDPTAQPLESRMFTDAPLP